jgi:methionyl-tRNA formyltransferase
LDEALESASDRSPTEKKRLLFLGTPEVSTTVLLNLCDASLQPDCPYEVVGVVTQPAKRRKRKGPLEMSPVGLAAEALERHLSRPLTILCPESARDDSFLSILESDIRPDICVTAAYGQYLPKRFLDLPKHGTLNIHPSLLPRWRGASPVQRSLEAGDNPVGVTVLFTVSKMDAGPIVAQQAVPVAESDTATTVLPMLFEVGTRLLLDILPDVLSGKVTMETSQQQREEEATSARMIDSSEAELRVWEESAIICHNRARGFSMWPQTFLTVRVGDRPETIRLKVLATRLPSSVEGGREEAPPSRVIIPGPSKSDGLYVTCGDGSVLELLEVQPPTRRAFPARDFQNGYPGETIRWVHPSDNRS